MVDQQEDEDVEVYAAPGWRGFPSKDTMRKLLLAALFCLFSPLAMAQQGSNLCSYPAVPIPVPSSACFPVNVNGVTKTATIASLTQQNVSGPTSSVTGDVAIFGNTTGTLLKDVGAPPALKVGSIAALGVLPVPVAPFIVSGTVVRVTNYSGAVGISSPPVDYYLTQTPCAIDAGSCIAGSAIGYYWHITAQTTWDPRWWGSYGDVTLVNSATTVTANSCNVTVTGANFVATDIGKFITLTDNQAPNANGPTYTSTIAAGTLSTALVVAAPCPNFSSSLFQIVYYGHADDAPINKAITYLGTLPTVAGGQPVLNGGGLSYGVVANPVNVNTNIAFNNFDLTSLAVLPFTQGVLSIGASYSTGLNDTMDCAFLPNNCITGTTNGTIVWQYQRAKNWLGSTSNMVTLNGATTNNASTFTGTITACVHGSGSTGFRCTLTAATALTGTIQPGQGVSDGGVNIPNGTYVIGYADNVTAGGLGTYTIYNATLSPAVTSQVINTLSLDVNVTLCTGTNFDRQINSVYGNIGMFSHHNVSVGVPDRTMIVACPMPVVTASMAGNTLTVTATNQPIKVGYVITGSGVSNATITGLGSGTGGAGTYTFGGATQAVSSQSMTLFSNIITLNKAPNKVMSGVNLTFYQDSNGVYLPQQNPLTLTGNVGIQFDHLTTNVDSFLGIPENQYGCSVYSDSAGGSAFENANTFQGASGFCFGPDAAGNKILTGVHLSNYGSNCCEINGPTVVAMDGSLNTTINNLNNSGQIQIFSVAGGVINPKVQINDPSFLQNTGSTEYVPGNTVWIYTELANSLVDNITLSPFGVNQLINAGSTNILTPNAIALTTGGPAGAWGEYTGLQLNSISQSPTMLLPIMAGTPMTLASDLNMMGNAIFGGKGERIVTGGSFTLSDADCGYDRVFTTNGATVTVPATLGGTISTHTCMIHIISGTGVALTFARGTGTTNALFNGGTNSSSVSTSANVPTFLWVPANSDGASAQAYLMKMSN